jgi:hypothetical protein
MKLMKNKNLLTSLMLLILTPLLISCNMKENAPKDGAPMPAKSPSGQNPVSSPSRPSRSPASPIAVDLDLTLLLTDFYAPNRGQQSEYGYYIYLVFVDNSSTTAAQRAKASEAFVCSFSSATGKDVKQLNKETIALFLAPVVSRGALVRMRQSRHPQELLRYYSYSEGQLFKNKISDRKVFESIAVLGSRTMLNPRNAEPFSTQVEVLDLSQFSPHEIRETIVELRKVVLNRENVLPQFESLQHTRIELRIASFFESVGQGLISMAVISSAIAEESECL